MKYRGHETFSIRRNWLAKGILAVNENPGIFTDKHSDPTDFLGIGRNMVLSLRYWLRAVKLCEEQRDTESKRMKMHFTPLGELVRKNDPFVEENGTLWLLHCNLAGNLEAATSWYFFFNEFNLSEFTKEDFVSALKNFDRMNGGTTALRSFEDDFECIMGTYVPRFQESAEYDPEDNLECPFSELGLVERNEKSGRLYRKIIPPQQAIPPLVLLSVLYEHASKYPGLEIPLSDIQNRQGNAGKLFNLDTMTLMDVLCILENRGLVNIVRTAGLDVVRLSGGLNAEVCIERYYEELKK